MHKSFLLAIAALLLNSSALAEVEFARFELANGIKVVVVEAPSAQRQTILTFVPVTMANDARERAQWSHLLEHMVIRTTDPQSLNAQGIEINGETTHGCLRLDAYAEPGHWKQALERHAKWLRARSFDPVQLEREKGNIAAEEQTTSASGATTKFAIAAWNQIVIHGSEHAAVHGDVANAKAEDVQSYAERRLGSLEDVMVATIGPAKRDEVKAAIEALHGELKSAPRPVEQQQQNAGQEEARAELQGTWDLPTRHLMLFWRLPELHPTLRAAAHAAAGTLQMKLKMQMLNPEQADVREVFVYPCVTSGGGDWFIIDCCLSEQGDPKRVSETIAQTLTGLGDAESALPVLKWWLNMQAMQLYPPGAPESMRKQLPARLQHLTEGVWLLAIMNIEWEWGMEFKSIMEAFKSVEADHCEQLLTRLRDPQQRRQLLLEPAKTE